MHGSVMGRTEDTRVEQMAAGGGGLISHSTKATTALSAGCNALLETITFVDTEEHINYTKVN